MKQFLRCRVPDERGSPDARKGYTPVAVRLAGDSDFKDADADAGLLRVMGQAGKL
jgi:hypothetical protein